jgi:hypothetical protein
MMLMVEFHKDWEFAGITTRCNRTNLRICQIYILINTSIIAYLILRIINFRC